MAHFFKYSHRPLHKGTKEYEDREVRDNKLREEGLKQLEKAGSDPLKEARESRLKKVEEAKMLRKLNKGSAIKKTLEKHK